MLINKVIRLSLKRPCFLLRLKNNYKVLKPYFFNVTLVQTTPTTTYNLINLCISNANPSLSDRTHVKINVVRSTGNSSKKLLKDPYKY